MTDKTKMSNLESYQELTIQISTLNMKLDKLLELAMKPQWTAIDHERGPRVYNNPPQWPNESHIDYLKRIGQYNEASSDNETFEGSYK